MEQGGLAAWSEDFSSNSDKDDHFALLCRKDVEHKMKRIQRPLTSVHVVLVFII